MSYPDDWQQRRQKVFRRDGYECQNCLMEGAMIGPAELECHHIVPKESGGTHQLNNLVTLCEQCHEAVHTSAKAPTAESSVPEVPITWWFPDRTVRTAWRLVKERI